MFVELQDKNGDFVNYWEFAIIFAYSLVQQYLLQRQIRQITMGRRGVKAERCPDTNLVFFMESRHKFNIFVKIQVQCCKSGTY